MAAEKVPYGRVTQTAPAISEIHVLWITAGLGCDGDSVSITAATQPSIEDVLLGAIPGLPKVHLHNPVVSDSFRPSLVGILAQRGNLTAFGGFAVLRLLADPCRWRSPIAAIPVCVCFRAQR